MDYLLGRNALNWSYITGYGEPGFNSVNQHSRWWADQLDPSLPNPPPGSLSGGPNSQESTWDPTISALYPNADCPPQQCYVDDIQSWSTNEITINWNSALSWVASFVADQEEAGRPRRR
jgi:endoglucanase